MVALADIALQPEGALVSLGDISERQSVSLPYLEQLFVKLRRAGACHIGARTRRRLPAGPAHIGDPGGGYTFCCG